MRSYELERLGLNERDTELLLLTLNGLSYSFPGLPTSSWLHAQLASQIQVSHEDLEEIGVDLATMERNPELPFEYHDLFEKVSKFSDAEAAAVVFFASGFFAGRSLQA